MDISFFAYVVYLFLLRTEKAFSAISGFSSQLTLPSRCIQIDSLFVPSKISFPDFKSPLNQWLG